MNQGGGACSKRRLCHFTHSSLGNRARLHLKNKNKQKKEKYKIKKKFKNKRQNAGSTTGKAQTLGREEGFLEDVAFEQSYEGQV